jgi:CMP/dCMP kinase
MKITIGGTPGSGKSTIAKILARDLNLKRYYMGQIQRDIAKERGLNLQDSVNSLKNLKDFEVDKITDDYQIKFAKENNDFIIEGRTSFHFIPESIKIFIKASLDVGTQRIFKSLKKDSEARNEGNFDFIEDLRKEVESRKEKDRQRYLNYIGKDIYDESNYDIVIDTSNLTISQVVEKIKKELKKFI